MDSPGNSSREGKSVSKAVIEYIVSPVDKIAIILWAVTLQLQSQTRSLAHPDKKKIIHKTSFGPVFVLHCSKMYCTALYPTTCQLQTLSKKDLITQRLEIPPFLIFLKFLFGLLRFVLHVKKTQILQNKIVCCDNTLTQ